MPTPARTRPPHPPPLVERRGAERFELLAQVELRRHDEIYVLPIANISASGMLLRIDDASLVDLAVHEHVSVFLEVSELSIELTLDATIVRVSTEGSRPTAVAMMWKPIDAGARAQLVKLLEHARRQPGSHRLGDGQR